MPRVRLHGDVREFEELIAKIAKAGSGRLARDTAKTMGRESHKLAEEGAAAAINPQGRKWRPLKRGKGKALRWLAMGLRQRPLAFTITPERRADIATFHQKGAKSKRTLTGKPSKWRLPVRRILPKKRLPPRWAKELKREVQRLWSRPTWFGRLGRMVGRLVPR